MRDESLGEMNPEADYVMPIMWAVLRVIMYTRLRTLASNAHVLA